MSTRLGSLITCAALVASPVRAFADGNEDAKTHINNAAAAHKAGDFALAKSELEAAYALDPKPALLYALGQVDVKLGNCSDAISYYEKYLATNPPTESADATTQAISVCKLALEQAKRQTPDAPPGPATPVATPVVQPPPVQVTPTPHTPWFKRPIGVGLLGGGVVGVGVGAVLFASARSLQSDADHATTYARAEQLDGNAHDRRTVSLVVGGVGLGLIAGGVVYYVLGAGDEEAAHVAVMPTSGGAMLSWGGSL
ncbi:MAG TPA: hypothetical protein VGM90_18220 [Kofleriaceae bacterium]|jgi:tetratricopeptide (TPR) repeat protein